MGAVIVKALADLRRRRLQATVIFLTVLLAMAAGTTAVTLMSQTRDPYQIAFDKQRGAHLQVAFNATTDPQVLGNTPALIGASASGGPYPASNIQFRFGDRKFYVDAVGRENPRGAVEVLSITSGRWPMANDEISRNGVSDADHTRGWARVPSVCKIARYARFGDESTDGNRGRRVRARHTGS